MIRVSVILPTFRLGGLDLTKYSLLHQSFRDFELILVDELYCQRKDEVRKYFKGINLKHIPPFRVNDYFSSATCRNAGLSCAEGELVVFTNDYTWFAPDCIERHWDAYNKLEGKYAVTGFRINMDGFKVVDDLNTLYAFGSEIKSEPNGRVTFVDDRAKYRGRELLGYYELSPSLVFNDNSSIPLEVALELNGFDTHFDGGIGYLDIDFFSRAFLLGCRALMDFNNVVIEVKSNHIEKGGNFRTLEENRAYHFRNIDAIRNGKKDIGADNPYSLRGLRCIFGVSKDAERKQAASSLPVF